MKVILCAINSRFSQTSPAIRSLALHAQSILTRDSRSNPVLLTTVMREYTTAQPVDAAARDLFGLQGDLYAFSCYIWNRRTVFDVIAQLRMMLPHIWIIMGGPEVSFNTLDIMKDVPSIDGIIAGEGEASFTQFLQALADQNTQTGHMPDRKNPSEPPWLPPAVLANIPGLTWRDGNRIISNAPTDHPLDLASLPFPYEMDLATLPDRMLYYESSRGCPFRCAYCLSSIDQRMRYRPLEQTLAHLDRFLQSDARLVKLVDRTFNCDPDRARAIWSHLIRRYHEHPYRTCFHFEIAADLLTDADIGLLSAAPKGIFQLEIGVQSTDPATLKRINRHCDLPKLLLRVRQLQQAGRQHLHLDLIAGLPGERMTQVIESFNQLYRLQADQLQLGFLKLLPGTPILLEISVCDYRHQPFPPYEVLSSRDLSAAELCALHQVEAVLELFGNSGLFQATLPHLIRHFESPFAFFRTLADEQAHSGDTSRGLSVDERASILDRFARKWLLQSDSRLIEGLLRFDHYRGGRKDAPAHLNALEATASPAVKARITELRHSTQPGTRIRVETYPFSVLSLMDRGDLTGGDEWVVYDLSGPGPVIKNVLSIPPADG